MVVYLADCGGPCAAFRPAAGDRVWFKVWEAGLLPGFSVVDRDGWNQFPYANAGWNVSLPRRLRPGNYLVRHEIIYIENDPAQFYPYCAQLAVEGDGDEVPGDEFKVAFPGAYSAADPGIAVAGIFYAPGADQVTTWPMNYTIPGPPVWTGGD
ncbi:glycosyl hydrolase family 61-domain-containing protein [Lasiosphaeria miniovina]|uniref:lytic cellulose monooxygenase (C4-dehydrogenating) n=1 Tax=Lasiosphaeria miniovina TaxID=1954250 RepID=A0AA40AKP5_9PEZI|nr:glycosyl hydrolase family 61-domain-containing protein [Lasiosphaeria miniovina]KAK0717626.1 glycosyl hydrolase family 61-domain-containing protein [Lasiosphaeria miniovina]